MRHLELWVGYYIRWNPRMKPQVEYKRGVFLCALQLETSHSAHSVVTGYNPDSLE
jgi:hypothetical protein